MADKSAPDDKAALAALEKLKAYNSYKATQLQTAGGGPSPVDQALTTVEMWSNDLSDDGAAWGQKKQVESNEKIQEADKWNEQVRQDDMKAAKESEAKSKLDMNQIKADLKKKLDDYEMATKMQADAGSPGFKGKLAEVKAENAEAKQFIDNDLEKAADLAEKKGAEMRQKRKLIAGQMNRQAEDGKKWKGEFGDQPAKYPAGQRADVEAALDQIEQWAGGKSGELAPFGAKAVPHVEALKKMQGWASSLKPKVAAQGAAAKGAKATGKSGVAESRTTIAQLENFQASLETDANENTETFRRWTDYNNKLAKQWINGPTPKHQEWAQAWLKTQK